MDSEKPPSLRSLLTRMVCTLVALVVLYVLSSGPSGYVWERSMNSRPLLEKFYAPLKWAHQQTPLLDPISVYQKWWADLAIRAGTNAESQTPPAPP